MKCYEFGHINPCFFQSFERDMKRLKRVAIALGSNLVRETCLLRNTWKCIGNRRLSRQGGAFRRLSTIIVSTIQYVVLQGDRVGNLTNALRRLEEYGRDVTSFGRNIPTEGIITSVPWQDGSPGTSDGQPIIRIECLSRLYESAPQLVTDQPAFLNAAALIRTTLDPKALLSLLKNVEKDLGRTFGPDQIRWGPRPIDLDIIFYEDECVRDGELLDIPHPRWQERDFVKAPLADLMNHADGVEMSSGIANTLFEARRMWEEQGGERMLRQQSQDSALVGVLPMGGMGVWHWTQQTHVMGVLNTTPDSFSDGGKYNRVNEAVERVTDMLEDGADIIDIGGQSTRPGATQVGPDEEWARIRPVLENITRLGKLFPISVDTFYSNVAERAVAAGATIINDVSGGLADGNMFATVAKLGVPYILMHMRGTPDSMQSEELTKYENVCRDVATELQARCNRAVDAGIESWRIILDPGLGFAKTSQNNIDLIKGLGNFRKNMGAPFHNAPILLGPSRKKFLGNLTGQDRPEDRDWATCAVSAISALRGCNIIRAHNVKAVRDAVRVADAFHE